MYTHCQQLDALGGRAAPSALALANGSARGGRGKSISSPPVRGAVRNIVFRQTVCVLCWALGIALVLALGYICHRLWLGRANFLATIVPMSFAILALACVPHRLILGKNRHPLAFQQIGLSQAAFSLSVAFLPLLIVQVLNDAQRIWWLLAWLSLTIMLVLAVRSITWTSGWNLANGGVVLLGGTSTAERLAASVGRLNRRSTINKRLSFRLLRGISRTACKCCVSDPDGRSEMSASGKGAYRNVVVAEFVFADLLR